MMSEKLTIKALRKLRESTLMFLNFLMVQNEFQNQR
jgi:hypothetical protein